jgi:nucleotide-binding universal stress UspA family protein
VSIVVGHDGTECSDDASTLGAQIARATGEDLIVVTVYPEENPIGAGRVDAEWVAYMREQAEEANAAAQRFLASRDVPASFRVVGSHSAAHGLDDVAEEAGASMVVVGSAQRGPRRRVLAGSTAERLLHGASCPVAVAPRALRERAADAPLARIGVAYVNSDEAREALSVAVGLVQRTQATLTLYTVVAPRAEFSPVAGRASELSLMAAVRESVRSSLDAALASLPEGVEAADELLEGEVVDELAALDERECDLLVCGSRGYGPVRRVLLGGVSRKLMRRAACPIVVVPRGAS